MNIDFISIRTYLENKEENIFLKGFWYSVIIGILLILIILFSCCKKVVLYYENILVINNDKVILKINYQDVNKILENKEIIINNHNYNYQIFNVLFNEDDYSYQVNIVLSDRLLIENGVLEYKISFGKESVLNYIVRVMKGD